MRRVICMVLAVLMIFSLAGCGIRLQIPEDPSPTGESEKTDTSGELDEMAAYAYDLYKKAIDNDASRGAYTASYTLTVNDKKISTVETSEKDGEILIKILTNGEESSGYYKDGVAYIFQGKQKYWFLTDEDGFYSALGFSESPKLTEEMFATALVIDNPDGTRTVSCPLADTYATPYAQLLVGAIMGARQVEVSVTVDENDMPTNFTDSMQVVSQAGLLMDVRSVTEYVATDHAVVITPPSDLNEYKEK